MLPFPPAVAAGFDKLVPGVDDVEFGVGALPNRPARPDGKLSFMGAPPGKFRFDRPGPDTGPHDPDPPVTAF